MMEKLFKGMFGTLIALVFSVSIAFALPSVADSTDVVDVFDVSSATHIYTFKGTLNGNHYDIGPIANLEKDFGVTARTEMTPAQFAYMLSVVRDNLERNQPTSGPGEDAVQEVINVIDGKKTEVMGEVNPILKPLAWNGCVVDPTNPESEIGCTGVGFKVLLEEANKATRDCESHLRNELGEDADTPDESTGVAPIDVCPIPEVVLGFVYFGLFDPAERVAFKYYQGDDKKLPSFCPSANYGYTCTTEIDDVDNANAVPRVRGVHPLEDVHFFYQAQQFIEADEENSARDLCDQGGGLYQDCIMRDFDNLHMSPVTDDDGNPVPGVWKALPGSTTSAVMQVPNGAGVESFTYTAASETTELDGVDTYTADQYGIPDFGHPNQNPENSEGVNFVGEQLDTVLDAANNEMISDPDVDTIFKQLVYAVEGSSYANELAMPASDAKPVRLVGTIYHEAEGEETDEIVSESGMLLNQWPIKAEVAESDNGDAFTVVGETFIDGDTGTWNLNLQFEGFSGERFMDIDIDADVLDSGSGDYAFIKYFYDGTDFTYDPRDYDTQLHFVNWGFDPANNNSLKGFFRRQNNAISSVPFTLKLDETTVGSFTATNRGF